MSPSSPRAGWWASCRSATSSRPRSSSTRARSTPSKRRWGPGLELRALAAQRRAAPGGSAGRTRGDGRPLRVAVTGAGPAGFYTVEHLFRQPGLAVEVDLYDRLPTPYGLVRFGVAPDHQKIKSVSAVFDKV